jgi:hypothetical protein
MPNGRDRTVHAKVLTFVPTTPWVANAGCGKDCNIVMAELACMSNAFFNTKMFTLSAVSPWTADVAANTEVGLDMFINTSKTIQNVCFYRQTVW